MLLRLPFRPKRYAAVGHIRALGVWEQRILEVGCSCYMVVEGEERHSQVEGRVHHIGLGEELHTVLGAGHHIQVEERGRRMAVVEERRMVVEEGHHKAVVVAGIRLAVVDIDLEGGHHMVVVVVEDSFAEEDIDLEEGYRKAVEGDSLAEGDSLVEGEGIGHSLAAGNLRGCQLMRAHDLREVTHDLAAERRMEADNHLDYMPSCLLICNPSCLLRSQSGRGG